MVRNRNRRGVIAAIATVLWLAYMMIGLGVIDALPTVGGEGPEGAAAFVGLVWGVVAVGLVHVGRLRLTAPGNARGPLALGTDGPGCALGLLLAFVGCPLVHGGFFAMPSC